MYTADTKFEMPNNAYSYDALSTLIQGLVNDGMLTLVNPGSMKSEDDLPDIMITKPFCRNWPNIMRQGDVLMIYPNSSSKFDDQFEIVTRERWDKETKNTPLPYSKPAG